MDVLAYNDKTFFDAICTGDVRAVKRIVLGEFDIYKKIHGFMPAEWCIISGNVKILELLFYTYPEEFENVDDLMQLAKTEMIAKGLAHNSWHFFSAFAKFSDKDILLKSTKFIQIEIMKN